MQLSCVLDVRCFGCWADTNGFHDPLVEIGDQPYSSSHQGGIGLVDGLAVGLRIIYSFAEALERYENRLVKSCIISKPMWSTSVEMRVGSKREM